MFDISLGTVLAGVIPAIGITYFIIMILGFLFVYIRSSLKFRAKKVKDLKYLPASPKPMVKKHSPLVIEELEDEIKVLPTSP